MAIDPRASVSPSKALVKKPKGQVPFFTKENAREMQAKSIEAKKRNARARAIATRSDMQDLLLPNVAAMIQGAVDRGDQAAFWKAFEHAFGRAPESIEVQHEGNVTIVVQSAFQEPRDGS